MPYMTVHQTKDNKWHRHDCPLLTEASRNGISQTVGSTATKPPPPRKSLCGECLLTAPIKVQHILASDFENATGERQTKMDAIAHWLGANDGLADTVHSRSSAQTSLESVEFQMTLEELKKEFSPEIKKVP